MRNVLLGLSLVTLLLSVGSAAQAADAAPHAAAATTSHGAGAATSAHPKQPVLPAKSPLPGTMMIVILGLFFLPAAIVGPMVRYHAPEEAPEPSSHDDHGHAAHDAHGHGHGH